MKKQNNEYSIKPSQDRILVEFEKEEEEQIINGIVLKKGQSVINQNIVKATIISVGNGKRNNDGKLIPNEYNTGDIVLVMKDGGLEIKHGKHNYKMYDSVQVIAVVNE